MAVSAGLMMLEDAAEPVREAGALACVMMDSWGPAPERLRQRREMELKRDDSLLLTLADEY
jgi:hypothetical protein